MQKIKSFIQRQINWAVTFSLFFHFMPVDGFAIGIHYGSESSAVLTFVKEAEKVHEKLMGFSNGSGRLLNLLTFLTEFSFE